MKASRRFLNRMVLLFTLFVAVSSPAAKAGNPSATHSTNHLLRGLDLASRKYPEEAVAEFKKCNDLSAASALQLRTIAQAYFEAGEPESSLKVIDYALLQERVKHDTFIRAVLLELRGNALVALNRRSEAVESYKLAASTNSAMACPLCAKAGELLMTENKYKEALPLLNKAVVGTRMKGFVYQNIGHCYLELKDPAKAIVALTSSIEAFETFRKKQSEAFLPGLVGSHKYLVRAYKEAGKKEEAVLWQKRLDSLVTTLDKDFFGNH